MRKTLFFVTLVCLIAGVALAQVTVPPAPTNLVATQNSNATPLAKLTWNGPTGSYGFAVYRSTDDTSRFNRIALVNTAIFNDYGIEFGHTYYYYVTTVALSSSSARLLESAPSNIAKITFTAPERVTGVIAGTVKDDSTGKPISRVTIFFYPLNPKIMTLVLQSTVTDSLGQYSAKLDTGAYKIKAQPLPSTTATDPGYQAEWYNNKKDMATADTVIVIMNASVVADFGLSKPHVPPVVTGIIKGKVIDDSTALPIRGILIRFYKKSISARSLLPTAITDSLGSYTATLDTGSYLVHAEGLALSPAMPVSVVYQPEWYDNATDVAHATVVPVTQGSTFTANFGLSKPATPTYANVEGTVTDTLGTPLRNATVVLMRSFQELSTVTATSSLVAASSFAGQDIDGIGYCRGVAWSGKTDSLGNYKAKVLAGHDYVAMAEKWGYLPEYYNNQSDPLLANIITVGGDVKNINFSLAPIPVYHNSISGIVRDSAGTGVPSIVVLMPVKPLAIPRKIRFGHTDSTGVYTIGDVVAGKYVVLAVPYADYAPAFYKAGAYGVSRWELADQVAISGDTSGIDIGVVPISSTGFVRLHGRILAAGAPLSGVRIMASSASGALLGYGLTNASGYYAIEGLPAGSVTITADRQDYAAGQQSVTVPVTSYDVTATDITLTSSPTTDVEAAEGTPTTYVLAQNYPNPFNPSTVVSYQLPAASNVRLVVFDVLGREVAELVNGRMASGSHDVSWNAKNVASGVYFYRLTVKDGDKMLFSGTKKMLLVR